MHDDAILTLVSSSDSDATFTVQFVGKHHTNRYQLWVQLDGKDSSGVEASRGESGISAWLGDTASVTVPKGAGVTFGAYVWLFPDNTTPVSNVVNF